MAVVRDELCGRTLGEFVLRERIGEGGFGAVYRCEQPLLGREAVVKVLHRGLRASDVIIQRFLREAQLASRLDHPYAAHVYAFGVEKDDGLLWIAMEMVHGTTLDRWLLDRGRMPLDQLVPFFERIAEVVHTVHERGIVHRDLKPSNVMVIERAGRLLPKLIDLGIAKVLDEGTPRAVRDRDGGNGAPTPPPTSTPTPLERPIAGSEAVTILPAIAHAATLTPTPDRGAAPPSPLTQDDAALGSPPYMAPEQWYDAQRAGPRADLYALAILAYEAIAGARPFHSSSVSGFAELHARGTVPALAAEFPAALNPFFQRALAKKPGDRPATALELAAELRVACGLADATVDLPRLDDGVRDAWLADAPQPLAEGIAALDGARNLHQARDAAADLARSVLRYLVALGLAARAQVRIEHDDPALVDLLRAMRRRDLADGERVRLIRLLVKPFADRRGAHPIPELVDLATMQPDGGRDSLDLLLERQTPSDGGAAGGDHVRSHVVQIVGELVRLLRRAAFVLDYRLVVPSGGALEQWTGLRRTRRALATVRDATAALDAGDRKPLLLDRDGKVALMLWPVIQIVAPTGGSHHDVFVYDGRGRHGARLVSAPAGFEHHDAAVWDWLGEHVVGDTGDPAATAAGDTTPYLGLASFAAADADKFVGREREIDSFVNRLRGHPLQLVVGASGAGKSSFVHAGVVPALPAGWRVVTMRPGATPIATLAARLSAANVSSAQLRPLLEASPAAAAALVAHAAGDGAIVLVVDQLEELFTLCGDDGDRQRFAAVLAELAATPDTPTRVIGTIRDDFLMRAESLAPLRPRMSSALFLLGNPSRDDLVRTVVEPARRAGYELSDSELAHEMVDVVADRPGALALLSFTASRLWELRDRRFHQLPRRAYEAMGGVGGALGRHAEATLTSLASSEQPIVRDAFRHLVTADGTRAVLSLAELRQVLANPRADAVIDKLVSARLLVVSDVEGDARVEIAHEALIAAWPRLETWVREDAEGSRFRDQLRAAARQWNDRDRPRGLLWRDEVLSDLERWRRRSDAALTEVEGQFADASRGLATRGRRLRRGALVLSIAILVAAAFVFFALSRRADRAAADARRRLVESYVENARSSLDGSKHWDALRNLVAARKMGTDGPSFEIMRGLAREPARAMQFRIRANRGATYFVRFSADGGLLATAGEDGAALWNARTGALHARLSGHTGGVRDVAFDADGKRVATAGADATLRIWDADSGRELAVLRGGNTLNTVVWRSDGRYLATGEFGGEVSVWDVDGRTRAMTVTVRDSVEALVFGRRYLALGSMGGDVVVVDPEARKEMLRVAHGERVRGIDLDSTETRLVTGSADASVRIWNVATGEVALELRGPSDWVTQAEFSPDDNEVVAAARDGTARIWNATTGVLRRTLGGHQGAVWAGIFDPQGRYVATAAEDGSARLWDRASGIALAVYDGHANLVRSAAFSPDGRRLATASYDGSVVLWSVQASYLIADWVGATRRTCNPAHRRRGSGLAAVACPDDTRIYDLHARALVTTLPGSAWVTTSRDTAWTIDGTTATVRSWDVRGGAELPSRSIAATATTAATTETGVLVVGDAVGGVHVFDDPASPSVRVLATGGGEPVTAVTVLAGGVIASASISGRIHVWRASGDLWATLDGPRRPYDFEVAPDGRSAVFIGGENADVGVLSLGEPPTIRWLQGHKTVVIAAHFEAGRRLWTTSADGTAIRWDLATGTLMQRYTGKHFITDVVLDRSNRVLIALDGQGRLSYFDVATGRRLGSTIGNGRLGLRVWLLDGETVAALDMNGGFTIWRVVFDRSETSALEHELACNAPGIAEACP